MSPRTAATLGWVVPVLLAIVLVLAIGGTAHAPGRWFL